MANEPIDPTTEAEPNPAEHVDDGAPPEPAAAVELTEVEQLAVDMGWKPEGDYKGDPAKWKPAKDFIKAERDINRSLKADVKRLGDQVERIASTSSKITERALNEQRREIEARFAQAVEDRDPQAAAQAANDMRALERDSSPSNSPEADFAAKNTWYGQDRKATAFAVMISQREAARGASVPDQLAAVDREMRQEFPELYGEVKPQPKPQPSLHTPGRPAPSRREKGYGDLPAPVKRAADDYAKLFQERHGIDPAKTKADYARDYWADQAA